MHRIPALLALAALGGCGLVGFHYPVLVNNQPLENPVRVRAVASDDTLVLEDGREIKLPAPVPMLADRIRDSEYEVEVTPQADVFVKVPGGIFCGTPWAQPIRIPIISESIHRFHRFRLGSLQ